MPFPEELPSGNPELPSGSPLSWAAVEVPFWRREPRTRYIVLFLLTLVTTTLVGATHYGGYEVEFTDKPLEISSALVLHGLLYSIPVLAILGAHEFGHYLACVFYRINASLPYFLPMPFFPFGTLGAVIRIRQPIPGKRALFDIGVAGPLAGFVVTVPVLLVGMTLSKVIPIPGSFSGQVIEFGEPLLLKGFAWLTFGSLPDGHTIVLHPLGFAAWFGMFATALNLLPVSQLDGGHIAYAVLGRKSTALTLGTIICLVGLATLVSSFWVMWTVLLVVMLFALGPHHPRVVDEDIPLDRTRMWLAALSLVVFILCFTPAPIELLDLVPGR
jgi:membrane-associated protease RseP (regulator of RpoE activity)